MVSDKRIELMPGIALVIDTDRVAEEGHTEIRLLSGKYYVKIKVTAQGYTGRTGPIEFECVFVGTADLRDE